MLKSLKTNCNDYLRKFNHIPVMCMCVCVGGGALACVGVGGGGRAHACLICTILPVILQSNISLIYFESMAYESSASGFETVPPFKGLYHPEFFYEQKKTHLGIATLPLCTSLHF